MRETICTPPDPCIRQNHFCGVDIPGTDVVHRLFFGELDRTCHPAGLNPCSVEKPREERVGVPIIPGLRLQRCQGALHEADVGLKGDRVGDVLEHLLRQVIERCRKIGDGCGRLRSIGRHIDIDRSPLEVYEPIPRPVGKRWIPMHQQCRQPREDCYVGGDHPDRVEPDVQGVERRERGKLFQNGIRQADVLNREGLQLRKPGQRCKRRKPRWRC